MTLEYDRLFDSVEVPQGLEQAARSRGWPEGLVTRMLTLRLGTQWVEQAIADDVPLERLHSMVAERERLSEGTLRVRLATRRDGPALIELFMASPEEIGDWEVTVDRSPNPFAQFDLQEHAMVVLLEDRSVPLATFTLAAKNALVGGMPMTVRLTGAWRTRNEARGLGYSALIRNNWSSPLDMPGNVTADYWYIRSQNVSAVNWMRALDESLLVSTRQHDDEVFGIPVTVHEIPATQHRGARQGIRPASPKDLRRCVTLINRTHRGLDLFRPYTEEYLSGKLDEGFWGERPSWWERNYGWEDYFVVESDGVVVACAGLWDRGQNVREIWRHTGSGEEQIRTVTCVLDLGCARGAELELARLVRFFAGRTRELGRKCPCRSTAVPQESVGVALRPSTAGDAARSGMADVRARGHPHRSAGRADPPLHGSRLLVAVLASTQHWRRPSSGGCRIDSLLGRPVMWGRAVRRWLQVDDRVVGAGHRGQLQGRTGSDRDCWPDG